MATCCSIKCEKRYDCAKHCLNKVGTYPSEDYSTFGSGTITPDVYTVNNWCGELGNYKMFEQVTHEWIKLYEQTPPVNTEVELKFIENGKERIQVNKLIPMMNGKYVWAYCDYDDCDEVVAWRKLPLKT